MLIVRFHYLLEGALVAVTDGGPLAEGRNSADLFENVADMFKQVFELAEELSREKNSWLGFWRRGQNVDTETDGNTG